MKKSISCLSLGMAFVGLSFFCSFQAMSDDSKNRALNFVDLPGDILSDILQYLETKSNK